MLTPEELLTGSRWKVLENVAKHGPKTASQIAQETGITLPAISQAMKLLEAYGYIAAKKQKRAGPGKPTAEYYLQKQTAVISLCLPGVAQRFHLAPDAESEVQLRTLIFPSKDRYWLLKLLCTQDNILEDCQAIGLVRSSEKELHLLVISEKVDAFRREHANITLESKKSSDKGREKKLIIIWSHTAQEMREGLERKEQYFIDLATQAVVFYDPERVVDALKALLPAPSPGGRA